MVAFADMVDASCGIDEFRRNLLKALQRRVDLGIGVRGQLEKVRALTPVETLLLMAEVSLR
jgi:hypothetical protein